jgi:hypothetical protein
MILLFLLVESETTLIVYRMLNNPRSLVKYLAIVEHTYNTEIFCRSLFQWTISILYLQASIEIPYLFDVRMYLAPDPAVLQRLRLRKCLVHTAYTVGVVAIVITYVFLEVYWIVRPTDA